MQNQTSTAYRKYRASLARGNALFFHVILIGTALIERFAGAYHIFALDRQEPASPLPPQAEYVQIDLASEASVHAALSTV